MTSAGRQHRRATEQAGQPVAQLRRRRSTTGVQDSSDGLGVRRRGRPRRPRRGPSASSAARTSSQACTTDGIALVPLGCDPDPADGCHRDVLAARTLRAASTARGQPEHRVVAVVQPGRARRGWPRRRGRAAICRAARCCWRRRRRRRGRPGRGPARRAARRRCRPGASSRRRGRGAAGRARPPHRRRRASCRRRRVRALARSGSSAPVSSREPGAGDAEPGAFLVGEVHDADRARGAHVARRAAGRPPRTRLTTPSGPSKAPPSGTESRWLPVVTPGPSRQGRPTRPTGCRCGRRSRSSPRRTASAANHSRQARSAGVQANRR